MQQHEPWPIPGHLVPEIPLQVFGNFFLGRGQAVGLWHPPHRSSDWRGTELRDGLCALFWHLVCLFSLAEWYAGWGSTLSCWEQGAGVACRAGQVRSEGLLLLRNTTHPVPLPAWKSAPASLGWKLPQHYPSHLKLLISRDTYLPTPQPYAWPNALFPTLLQCPSLHTSIK